MDDTYEYHRLVAAVAGGLYPSMINHDYPESLASLTKRTVDVAEAIVSESLSRREPDEVRHG